jgi:hypothetical protein
MVAEWVRKTFGDVKVKTNVRLGRVQPRNEQGQFSEDELTLLGAFRRFVDAVVWLPDRLILVEAALRAEPGKLSQLELYETLVSQTPELQDSLHLDVQKILLTCIEDPAVSALARSKGILPVVFTPSFFDEWFETLSPRKQRPTRS